ncbi:MAG: Na+/H+ antiporter NhaC family protein [Spirochaetaceae bacterium]|jgi:Na+/H+ antiporter NhaC|nr:Na+/H+ antiporter NhaC family protein [Spirochaetaceae bacterium]
MEIEAIQAGALSVLPPLLAIALALITKEVIFSLVLGILSGTVIYGAFTGAGLVGVFNSTVSAIVENVGGKASMIIFLSLLGALVALITRAGGARAYGIWAGERLKTKRGARLTTAFLGLIIFIDDYFNCLTVGTVMKPVTDRFKISREKLAYLIDATAAPICVIAPISSWSASAAGYFPAEAGISGLQAFLYAIPYNFYAFLTIFMVLWISAREKGDFGPMERAEKRAAQTDSLKDADIAVNDDIAKLEVSDKGRVFDLISPVVVLVVVCILSMLYYGGLWDGNGKSVIDAFADTDANMALSMGGFVTLVAAFFIYVPRKLISFKDYFASITAGVKAMVPAILILTLAWTIAAVCKNMLNTGDYIASLIRDSNIPVCLIPAILFIAACGIAYSTGTAWGTFGILIPISITVCYKVAPHLSIPALSAVMGGSVFGDHCSPISDTTILASTGAGCNHLDHVTTQTPYAMLVAAVCFIGYLVVGLANESLGYTGTVILALPGTLALLIAALLILPKLKYTMTDDK